MSLLGPISPPAGNIVAPITTIIDDLLNPDTETDPGSETTETGETPTGTGGVGDIIDTVTTGGTSSNPDTGSSTGGSSSGGGTPIDESAVRYDFSSDYSGEDIDWARQMALALQAREQSANLVESIGQAPEAMVIGQTSSEDGGSYASALVTLNTPSETMGGSFDMVA
ncbi:hypothetical protein [Amaricoccus macauensis]|uniref:hypothetical protein n=1 Tax=Amaricoccus macauensis TaxID=57001 RepID=UPI003C7CB2CC